MNTSVISAVIALTLGAAMALGFHHAHAGPNCTANSGIDSEELAFLTLLNDYRAERGLSRLAMTETLNKAAAWKSQHMASNGYFAHDDIGLDRTFMDRLRDCGYDFNTWMGENIAAGNETAAATFAQWRESTSHISSLLNPDFNAVGIGRAYDEDTTFGWYWTAEFGGVVDAAPTHPPAGPPVTSGDVDCTGGATSIDAALVLQFNASLIDLLPCPDEADVNGDDSIGPLDAALILQMSAELLAPPAPPPVSEPVTNGDADCTGGATSIDAALVLQFNARLTDTLPCPDEADVNGDGGIGPLDAALILQLSAGLLAPPG